MAGLGVLFAAHAHCAGTAFSYQGRLLDSGAPANGSYDLRFELFAMPIGGAPSAFAITNASTSVSNGVFTASLDFGANVFNGTSSWLEIAVRAGGPSAPFVTLIPRQALTPAPFSIYTLKAESLAGPLPDSQLSPNIARLDANQQFSGAVTFTGQVGIGTTNPAATLDVQGEIHAGSFSGSGSGLSNVVAEALTQRQIEKQWRVPIPFVTVTNADNPADFNGKGSVPYDFRIGKFEINNKQYAAFLNAVAADDPHSLYSSNMTVNVYGGITRSGAPGDYSYAPKPGREHHPVVWVDFHDALRFCNWLHHGQPTGVQDNSTTEDGAYTMTDEGMRNNSIARNPKARFWLPNDDEWYKAAYHQPAEQGGDFSDYWLYPTRSNDVPFSEPPPGGVNSMNACCDMGPMSTDVGAYFNSPGYYGTYDQAGNAQEWTEEIIYVTNRRLRGGSWSYNEFYARSSDFEFDTTDYDAEGIGFRVAGAVDP
jgi:sulfatase modifying factor 1